MSFFHKINNMTILSIFEKIFDRWDRETSPPDGIDKVARCSMVAKEESGGRSDYPNLAGERFTSQHVFLALVALATRS